MYASTLRLPDSAQPLSKRYKASGSFWIAAIKKSRTLV
jgi:hypothetical protein